MRALSIICYVLGFGSVALWLFGYLFISGLACAFGSPNGNCGTPAPWSLSGEDRLLMVIFPSMIVAVLMIGGWYFGQKSARQGAGEDAT